MMLSTDWLQLEGRTCVVTGAASGIGAAIATALAAVGAKVALLDRNLADASQLAAQITSAGGRALALECDVGVESSVAHAALQVAALGPVWGVVNNAGLLRSASLMDVAVADWNAVLAVNLTGCLLVARAFAQPMMAHGAGGSIVNIASMSANYPQSQSGAYRASKAGLVQVSRQMAVEWGAHGIRCNAICPGMVRTALSAGFYAVPGVEAKRATMTASRRVGEPQDIAHAALFLLSPRSAYINGTELPVDGGEYLLCDEIRPLAFGIQEFLHRDQPALHDLRRQIKPSRFEAGEIL